MYSILDASKPCSFEAKSQINIGFDADRLEDQKDRRDRAKDVCKKILFCKH